MSSSRSKLGRRKLVVSKYSSVGLAEAELDVCSQYPDGKPSDENLLLLVLGDFVFTLSLEYDEMELLAEELQRELEARERELSLRFLPFGGLPRLPEDEEPLLPLKDIQMQKGEKT